MIYIHKYRINVCLCLCCIYYDSVVLGWLSIYVYSMENEIYRQNTRTNKMEKSIRIINIYHFNKTQEHNKKVRRNIKHCLTNVPKLNLINVPNAQPSDFDSLINCISLISIVRCGTFIFFLY